MLVAGYERDARDAREGAEVRGAEGNAGEKVSCQTTHRAHHRQRVFQGRLENFESQARTDEVLGVVLLTPHKQNTHPR